MLKAVIVIALTVAAVMWLSVAGDPPEILVTPACLAEPLPNPCDTIDCDKPDTREIV